MLTVLTSPQFFPEKQYIFHVLFQEILGLQYQLFEQPGLQQYHISLPNGATLLVDDHFAALENVPPNVTNIAGKVPHPFEPTENIIGIFGRSHLAISAQKIECGLDLFASTFFMLTRWEENAPAALDKHGRFPASKSLAFQADFLHRPVVNEWAELIWQMLLRLGWNQARTPRQFKMSVSCDVDHPRLWWNIGDRFRTLGGALFKRFDFKEIGYFNRNFMLSKKDPYDIFGEWMTLFEQINIVAQFNFMGKRPRKSDSWYPIEHPFVTNLIQKIAQRGHNIGFHPSYEAFESQEVFDAELASLQALCPKRITAGRQHFLRFVAPGTWRMWQAAGLTEDSTLGYPEAEGFRCGICHDYPVFDVKTREMLPLREKPLIAMDVTLALYRKYTPAEAAEKLAQLRREVEKYGGEFTLLWHNSSWNTPLWESWKHVFLDFIAPPQRNSRGTFVPRLV